MGILEKIDQGMKEQRPEVAVILLPVEDYIAYAKLCEDKATVEVEFDVPPRVAFYAGIEVVAYHGDKILTAHETKGGGQ